MAEAKKTRQANLELLRILSMYMVVVMHLLGDAELLEKIGFGGLPYTVLWFASTLCHSADFCFVLISAYFLVALPFRPSRLLRLWLMVLFYSLFGILFARVVFHTPLDLNTVLYAVFPITSSAYWFLTQYFLLVAVSPLLNRLIRSMSKAELLRAIVLLGVLFGVIPTLLFWAAPYFSTGFDLPWFIVIYLVGAYIRFYGLHIPRPGLIYVAVCAVLTLSRLAFGTLALRFTGAARGAGLLYAACSPFFVLMSTCLFCVFQGQKVERCTKLVNAVASCVIGVYLLHMQKALNPVLMEKADMASSPSVWAAILRALLIAVLVFALGVGVEALRRQLAKLCREQALCRWFDKKTQALADRLIPTEQQ